jgi:membrane-bound ClpP family serine protease
MIIAILALGGLILVFLEFFLPGMILAVLGSILLLASIAICLIDTSLMWGILYILGLGFLVIGTCQCALWYLERSKSKDHFYLEKDQEGYVASQFEKNIIGKTAVALTELKPAGHITVEGKNYQALCETGFISKGQTVTIVGGKGSHLIVRKIDASNT